LDQLNRVKANPLLAQLIFVVPKGLGENFRSQEIEFPKKWKGKEMGIGEIPGIGPKKRKKLFDLGIKNSTQLIEAYNCQDENLKFVQSSLKKWMGGVEDEFLKAIPQYVMEV
jgi:nucleotidyltransferase/DNA polymerase involved in DNA repair